MDRKSGKTRKAPVIAVCAAAVCIALGLVVWKVVLPASAYEKAAALLDAGQYEQAIAAFEALDGYKDSRAQIQAAQEARAAAELETAAAADYEKALSLLTAGEYDAASAAFRALGEYRDSAQKAEDAITAKKDLEYSQAEALLDAGDFDAAAAAFKKLGGYRDSAQRAEDAKTAKKELAYSQAEAFLEAGEYRKALDAFRALDGYKDSVDRAFAVKALLLSGADVGSIIVFGTYEKDNDKTNGGEDIEWRVLAKENGRLLVISRFVIDGRAFHNDSQNVSWETSSLRS